MQKGLSNISGQESLEASASIPEITHTSKKNMTLCCFKKKICLCELNVNLRKKNSVSRYVRTKYQSQQ